MHINLIPWSRTPKRKSFIARIPALHVAVTLLSTLCGKSNSAIMVVKKDMMKRKDNNINPAINQLGRKSLVLRLILMLVLIEMPMLRINPQYTLS